MDSGYRIEWPERVIVYSADTSPTQAIIENRHGCDYLIAEAYTLASFQLISPHWQAYGRTYHASTRQAADIAIRTRPRLVILTDRGNAGCDQSAPRVAVRPGVMNRCCKR